MGEGASALPVNQRLLAEKLAELAAVAGSAGELLHAFDVFVRTASDDALVRINPVHFAQQHGFATGAVVEMFLHARKLGLLTMEWQYVCPGCGEIVERLTSLTSAAAHTFCQVCSTARDADLSDFVEVTFSVSPEVAGRVTTTHGRSIPRSTSSATASRRAAWWTTDLRFVSTCAAARSRVRTSRRARRRHLRLQRNRNSFGSPAGRPWLWAVRGRMNAARSRSSTRARRARGCGPTSLLAPCGSNSRTRPMSGMRYALMITSLPDHYGLTMTPFLSGAQLLSNQTFRELFGAETITSGAKSSRSMRAGIGGENENRACRDDRHTERQHGDRVGGRGWRSWCVVGFSSGDCGPRSNHFNGLPSGRPGFALVGLQKRGCSPREATLRSSSRI